MNTHSNRENERGIALVTVLLVMMLMSTLLVGMTVVVMSDQRFRFIDKDRGQAFYASSGALEKLTADLGNTFMKFVAPTNAQLTALTSAANQPVISRVSYTATSAPGALPASELSTYHCNNKDGVNRSIVTVGANGYTISFCALTATGNPTTTPDPKVITTGTYEGLIALKTPYQLDVTAKTATGGEVHLVRSIEAVAIPIFQFGIFSDVDLAFNAGDAFSFGGRVHTNGTLYLAEAAGNTLTLSDKVTAFREVVRQRLSNGVAITVSGHTGTVNMAKAPGSYRVLAATEGSVVDGPTSAQNEPTWTSMSLSTYKGYIKNGRTGAKQLKLPLLTAGGVNTDLVRRPLQGDDPASIVFQERLFSKASLRVMLSDTTVDITNLPTTDAGTAPLSLEAGNTYGGIPIAQSPGLKTNTVANGSNATTVKVNGNIDPFFQVSSYAVSVTSGARTFAITACTAKTATQISGCTVTQTGGPAGSIAANGAVVTASVNGGSAATTTSGNAAAIATGNNKTIKVASTAGFSPDTFWVDDDVVTCDGYDTTLATQQFSGCQMPGAPTANRTITTFALMPQGTSPIGGFIKIERQDAADSTWHDVTAEILGWGIGAPSQSGACDVAATDPSPNAILRLQRLHDRGQTGGAANCTPAGGAGPYDYWPNTLFDPREAVQRDAAPASGKIKVNGVMHYVTIDAGNLAKWFRGQAPYGAGTGALSKTDNAGYSIYISDRRNNRDAASLETAEFGWEDFVNPDSAIGTPNGGMPDAGEDVNGNGTLEVYGGVPNCNGRYNAIVFNGITCANAYYTTATRPTDDLATGAEPFTGVGRAMVNRPVFFRRAIKLVHGSTLGATLTGFTVVTENPAYVQGDWNANAAFNDPHAATSVIADAATLLSNAWLDPNSFQSPYAPAGRARSANSYYRLAVLAGKGAIFPQPAGTGSTFGTDGGAHVFLRFLEGTGANPDTIHYRGSLATVYYNRQATGVFKGAGTMVYAIPNNRDYAFDTDFLNPTLLPPLTPMFRDMNATGFSQELRPGK